MLCPFILGLGTVARLAAQDCLAAASGGNRQALDFAVAYADQASSLYECVGSYSTACEEAAHVHTLLATVWEYENVPGELVKPIYEHANLLSPSPTRMMKVAQLNVGGHQVHVTKMKDRVTSANHEVQWAHQRGATPHALQHWQSVYDEARHKHADALHDHNTKQKLSLLYMKTVLLHARTQDQRAALAKDAAESLFLEGRAATAVKILEFAGISDEELKRAKRRLKRAKKTRHESLIHNVVAQTAKTK